MLKLFLIISTLLKYITPQILTQSHLTRYETSTKLGLGLSKQVYWCSMEYQEKSNSQFDAHYFYNYTHDDNSDKIIEAQLNDDLIIPPYFNGLNVTMQMEIGDILVGQKFQYDWDIVPLHVKTFSVNYISLDMIEIYITETAFRTYYDDLHVINQNVTEPSNCTANISLKTLNEVDVITKDFNSQMINVTCYQNNEEVPTKVYYKMTLSFIAYSKRLIRCTSPEDDQNQSYLANNVLYLQISILIYSALHDIYTTYQNLPWATANTPIFTPFYSASLKFKWTIAELTSYTNLVEQFNDSLNNKFFISMLYDTDLISFDDSCGWGTETYNNHHVLNTYCMICPPSTYQNYLGGCYCSQGDYRSHFIGQEKKASQIINVINEVLADGVITRKTCQRGFTISQHPYSYCLAKFNVIYTEMDTSIYVVDLIANENDTILQFRVNGAEQITGAGQSQAFSMDPVCYQYLLQTTEYVYNKPVNLGYMPYYFNTIVETNYFTQENEIITANLNNTIIDLLINRDQTDPKQSFAEVTLGVNLYADLSQINISGEVSQTIFLPLVRRTLSQFVNITIPDMPEERSKFKAYTISDETTNRCYGCGLYFKNNIQNGQAFNANLCWNTMCTNTIKNYRLNFGDTIYVQFASSTRFTIIDQIQPEKIYCYLYPNINLGSDYTVKSLYNYIDPDCSITASYENNNYRYIAVITMAGYGRRNYQIYLAYSDSDKANGVSDQEIYFTFFVNNYYGSKFTEQNWNSYKGGGLIGVIVFFIGASIVVFSTCSFFCYRGYNYIY